MRFIHQINQSNNSANIMTLEFTERTGSDNPLNRGDLKGNNSTVAFVDIDNDKDLDAFIGNGTGSVSYHENTGSASNPKFPSPDGNTYSSLSVGANADPTSVDIDNDGDFDAFVGRNNGTVKYFKNTGNASSATFTKQDDNFFDYDPVPKFISSSRSTPAFVDIDDDGDFDVFVGAEDGKVSYYENTGSANSSNFSSREPSDFVVDSNSNPTFVDVDNDGDFDAFVGARDGKVSYYENTGSASSATFTERTGSDNPFDGIDFGKNSAPVFADIDDDGDYDAFIGSSDGTISYFENTAAVVSITAVTNSTSEVDKETPTNHGQFKINVSKTTHGGLNIDFSVNNNVQRGNSGTSRIGDDYLLYYLDGSTQKYIDGDSFFIADGADEFTVYVEPLDDTIYESDETITITVPDAYEYNVDASNNSVSVTIVDNEPTVSISDYTTTIYETSVDFDFGDALSFDGVDDYVTLGNPLELQITGNQTIEMWLKPANFDNRQNPYAKAYGGEGTITMEANGSLSYYYGTSGKNSQSYQRVRTEANVLEIDKWSHIALVRDFDSNKISWYIDGEEATLIDSFTPNYEAAVAGTNSAYIGNGYTNNFEGEIDEFRIWSTARTADEIQGNLYTSLDGTEDNLVAYYNFDEDYLDSDTITDLTANSNDGTLTNGDDTNFVDSEIPTFVGYIDLELDNEVTNEPGIIVNYQIDSNSTATQDEDFYNSQTDVSTTDGEPQTNSIFIPKGEDSGRIYLTALPDAVVEGDEEINLTLLPDFNQAISLDGRDDYIELTDETVAGAFDHGSTAFTITGWLKPNSLSSDDTNHSVENVFLARASDLFNDNFELGVTTGGNLDLYLDTNGGDTTIQLGNGELTTGEWHSVAVVFDAGNVTAYIDGNKYTGSVSGTQLDGASGSPFTIGGSLHVDTFYDGEIEELGLWDATLSKSEIEAALSKTLIGNETNLVAHYNFNQDSVDGTAIYDSTNNINNGTLVTNNKVLSLDGSGDYVSIGNVLPNAYTKEAWIKLGSGSGGKNIISSGDGTSTHAFYVSGSGQLRSGHNGDWSTVQDDETLDRDTWYHVAVTYDGSSDMKLYKNGVLIDTATGIDSLGDNIATNIGKHNGGNYFPGEIDDVRIWNVVRTADEIKSNFDTRLDSPETENGLVAYYTFDDNVADDQSGNGNTGSLNDNASTVTVTDNDVPITNLTDSITYDPLAAGGASYNVDSTISATIEIKDSQTYTSAVVIVDEYGDEVTSDNPVIVDEDGNGNFFVKLTSEPTDTVDYEISLSTGSDSITIVSSFDSTNWDTPQNISSLPTDINFTDTFEDSETIEFSSNDSNYDSDITVYFAATSDTHKLRVAEGGTILEETILSSVEITDTSDAFPDDNQAGEVNIGFSPAVSESFTLPFSVSGATNPTITSDNLDSLLSLHDALSLEDGQYVVVGNSSSFNFLPPITMEAWIKVDSFSQAWQTVIGKDNSWWQLSRNDETNTMYFGVGDSGGVSGNTNIADGEWHHVAGVYNQAKLLLYVDGELDGQLTTGLFAASPVLGDLLIGNSGTANRNFTGEIDEVRVWSTARSQEEIQAGLTQSLTGSETDLEIYYSFNDDSVSDTTITDLTNNGYDGTLINGDSSNFVTTDYHQGNLNIAAGQESATISIAGVSDNSDSGDETVTVSLQSGDDYNLDLNDNETTIAIDYEDPDVEFTQFTTVGNLELSDEVAKLLDIELAQYVTNDNGEQLATFNVALAQQPTADVTVTFNDIDNTVITFTPDNWNESQQVTVTEEIDPSSSIVADISTELQVIITSTDSTYSDRILDLPISTSILDIAFDPTNPDSTLVTSEEGDSVEFGVRLTTAPDGDVILDLSISDNTEGQFTIDSPTQLTFNAQNWDTYQTVTVEGVNDLDYDGNTDYTVNFDINANSTTTNYANMAIDFVTVTNQDDETEVEIGEVETEDDVIDNTSTVVASLSVDNSVITEGSTATFTVNLSQAVTEDTVVKYEVIDGSTTSGDDYTALTGEVTITNGNSSATIDLTSIDDEIDEDSESLEIQLLSPSSNVDVIVTTAYDGSSLGLQLNNGTEDIQISPGDELVFGDVVATVNTTEVVTISDSETTSVAVILDNELASIDINETATVIIPDDSYILDDVADDFSATVTINDNDTAKVLITSDTAGSTEITSLTTDESTGTAETFYVQLDSQPTDNVVVYLGTNDTEEGLLSDADETFDDVVKLAFSPTNWDTAQSVNINPVNDNIDESPVYQQFDLSFVFDSDVVINPGDPFTFSVEEKSYSEVHLFARSILGSSNIEVTLNYSDGSTSNGEFTIPDGFTIPDWYSEITETEDRYYWIDGVDRYNANSSAFQNANDPDIFGIKVDADTSKTLSSVTVSRKTTGSTSSMLTVLGGTGVYNADANDYQVISTVISDDVKYNEDNVVLAVNGDYDASSDATISISIGNLGITTTELLAGTQLSFTNGMVLEVVSDVTLSNSASTDVSVTQVTEINQILVDSTATIDDDNDNSTEYTNLIVTEAYEVSTGTLELQIDEDSNVTSVNLVAGEQLTFSNGAVFTLDADVTLSNTESTIVSGTIDSNLLKVAITEASTAISGDITAEVTTDVTEETSGETQIIVTTSYNSDTGTISLQINDTSASAIDLLAGTQINLSNGATVILNEDVTLTDTAPTEVKVTGVDNEIVTNFTESISTDITVTNTDDDTAGVTITTSDTSTTEGLGNNFFSVKLDSQPLGEVEVTFNPADDDIQLDDEFDGESITLTFDADNWSIPQNVNVTAVDDYDVEYDHSSTISVDVSSNDDSTYNQVTPPNDIKIKIADNDLPVASIEAVAGAAEAGAPGYFIITLDNPAPNGVDDTGIVVNYTVSGTADTDETGDTDDLKSLTGSVRIAPGETRSPLIAFPIDDFIVEYEDGTEDTVIVALSTSDDYQLNDANTATLQIEDNDEAGIRIVEVGTTSVTENQTSEFYVSLLSQPTADVTISLSNLATKQALEVTGISGNDVTLKLPTNATISSLNLVDGATLTLNGSDYTVNGDILINEDEEVTVTLDRTNNISTGDNLTYSYNELDFNNGSDTLTFNSDNWYQLQTVTVEGIDDLVVEKGDFHPSTIQYSVSSTDSNGNTADTTYDGFTVDDQTINIVDRAFDKDNTTESLTEGFLGLQDAIDNITLPIVGKLSDVSPSFLEDFLDNLINEVKTTIKVTAETLSESFTTAFEQTISDSGFETDLFNLDIEITNLATDNVEFFLGIEGEMTESVALGSDLGLPALGIGIKTEGGIELGFDYGIDLAFGINQDDGFYLNTEDTSFEVGAELALSDDFSAGGNLAFLQLDITNGIDASNGDNDGTAVNAEFMATLTNPNDEEDTQLTLSELNAARDGDVLDLINYSFSGDATLDLDVLTSFEGDTSFPSFGFNITSEMPIFNYGNADDEEEVSGGKVTLDGVSGTLSTDTANNITITVEHSDDDATSDIRLTKGTKLTFSSQDETTLGAVILQENKTFSDGETDTIKVKLADVDESIDSNDTGATADLESGDFNISFNDITLDLGEFVTETLNPVIGFIEELIEPFEPIIDVLQTEVELLETLGLVDTFDENGDGAATVIEIASTLATLYSGGENTLKYAQFFDAVTGIIELVETIEELGDLEDETIQIQFGDYVLENFSGASDTEDASTIDTESNGDSSSLADDAAETAKSSNKVGNFFAKLDELGIGIPLLEDPFTAINLLLGQDVDLVTYDIPELDIEFGIEQEFPIFASITGLLEGAFSIYSDLVVGYDTYGISQWKDADFDLEESYKILDGFYLSDVDPDTGEDVDELTLDATIAAGVSASAVVAKATVKGGITGTAALDVTDGGELTGTSDGKLRGSEVLDANSLLDLFSLSGSLEAFLEATVKVGIDVGLFEIMKTVWSEKFSVTLFEFELGSSGGSVSQYYVEGATVFFDSNLNGELEEGEPYTTTDAQGKYSLDVPLLFFDTNDNGKIDPEEGRIVSIGGTDTSSGLEVDTALIAPYGAEMVTPITTLKQHLIEAGATAEEAEAQLKTALDLPDVNLDTFEPFKAIDEGDERGVQIYQVHNKVQNLFIQGTEFATELNLDFDSDQPLEHQVMKSIAQGLVKPGKKVDLSNQEDVNTIFNPLKQRISAPGNRIFDSFTKTVAWGNQAVDEAFNDASVEFVVEDVATVKQFVQGQFGHLQRRLASGKLSPTKLETLLEETSPYESVTGLPDLPPPPPLPPATKERKGSEEQDIILGGDRETTIRGAGGDDVINGGNKADRLYGEKGDDQLHGGENADRLDGGKGKDHIDGSAGRDKLFGGEGADTLLGGADNDNLFGEAGDDLLDGGEGDDYLKGGLGNDTLYGGVGSDRLRGSEDNDLFVLTFGDTGNTIFDYVDGSDKLGLEISSFTNNTAQAIFENELTITPNGSNVEIYANSGNDLLASLSNVDALDISAEDFTDFSMS